MDAQSDPLHSVMLEPILRDYPEQMALADRMAMHGVPGVSVAVIEGGRLAWAGAHGVREAGGIEPVMPATRFQAGSISKAITATSGRRGRKRRPSGCTAPPAGGPVHYKV